MTKEAQFDSDQHAFDAGRLIGHLNAKGVKARSDLSNDISYSPVVKIEIEGQAPVWVRILPSDL